MIRRLLCWLGWHEWVSRCDYPFCKLPMCGDVSHYCPQCRGYEKEICKHCGNNIIVSLTNFKTVSFKFGLTWTCPGCHADFHIKKIELEEHK